MRISPVSARLSRHLTRLSFALVVVALAASCHSTQVAFQFRPPTSLSAATMVSPDSVVAPVPATAVAAPAVTALTLKEPTQTKLRPAQQVRQLRRVVAQALGQQPTTTIAIHRGTQSAQHVTRPQQTAEVGLGTTVFGVLGLIALPISLLGLLIWGGPVWAILAGLSALAILIAYLDPFG
jgi:hypothetical protein